MATITRLSLGGFPAARYRLLGTTVAIDPDKFLIVSDSGQVRESEMRYLGVVDGVARPDAVAGFAVLFVDTADGKLKIVYDDGTIEEFARVDSPAFTTGISTPAISTTSGDLSIVSATENVGINRTNPGANLDAYGASASPSLITNNGIISLESSANQNLMMGGYTAFPYEMWLQASDKVGDATPISINPLGGAVNVGAGGLALAGGLSLPVVAKTSNYTATFSDSIILCSGTFTVTLPAASTATGRIYHIKNTGTGTITVDGASSETIDSLTTQIVETKNSIAIVCDGSEWWIV